MTLCPLSTQTRTWRWGPKFAQESRSEAFHASGLQIPERFKSTPDGAERGKFGYLYVRLA